MELIGLSPIKQGAFSDVFFSKQDEKVYKLFISFMNPRADKYEYNEALFNKFRRSVFKSENDAYKILIETELQEYIPSYYGNPEIERVVNINGEDVTSHYLLDCCIALELVEGDSWKLGQLDKEKFFKEYGVHLDLIFKKMRSYNVRFTVDSNIIKFNGGFRIIDFAIEDFANFE